MMLGLSLTSVLADENVLSLFYLKEPFFGKNETENSLYLGTTIFIDKIKSKAYIADMFNIKSEKFHLRFGSETDSKNITISKGYMNGAEFSDIFRFMHDLCH